MHPHKTRKLNISAEETQMPPPKPGHHPSPPTARRAANLSPALSANKRTSLLQPDHVTQKRELCRGTPPVHWGVKSGLGLFVSYYHKRIRGNSDITTQWKGQTACSHFMTQTSQGQKTQVAT